MTLVRPVPQRENRHPGKPVKDADALTPRQRDVLDAIISAGNYPIAAHQLGMSLQTMKNHVSDILDILDVRVIYQAVILWDRWARSMPTERRRGDRRSGVERRHE